MALRPITDVLGELQPRPLGQEVGGLGEGAAVGGLMSVVELVAETGAVGELGKGAEVGAVAVAEETIAYGWAAMCHELQQLCGLADEGAIEYGCWIVVTS